MTAALRTLIANERAFVGVWEDVVLSVWRGDVEADDVRHTARAQGLAGAKGRKFAALAFIEPGSLQIREEARTVAAQVTEEGGQRLVGVAVVLPLVGFTGAIARTIAAGIHMVSRSSAPQRVFERVPDAAAWAIERLGHPAARAPELTAAVELARQTRA